MDNYNKINFKKTCTLNGNKRTLHHINQTKKIMTNQSKKQEAILAIMSVFTNVSIAQVESLINATNNVGGVSFVSLKGYSSDKSNNSEVANQLINIGASYNNMLNKDSDIYANFDIANVNVDSFNYETIDTAKLTLDEYKNEVKKALAIALDELKAPKQSKDTSADIWLNKALVFNLNTMRLSIFGQSVNKVVTEVGEYKVVKSAPKTIAKKLIERQAKGKAQTLRRFAIDNFNGNIKVSGETILID